MRYCGEKWNELAHPAGEWSVGEWNGTAPSCGGKVIVLSLCINCLICVENDCPMLGGVANGEFTPFTNLARNASGLALLTCISGYSPRGQSVLTACEDSVFLSSQPSCGSGIHTSNH